MVPLGHPPQASKISSQLKLKFSINQFSNSAPDASCCLAAQLGISERNFFRSIRKAHQKSDTRDPRLLVGPKTRDSRPIMWVRLETRDPGPITQVGPVTRDSGPLRWDQKTRDLGPYFTRDPRPKAQGTQRKTWYTCDV